jgi:hypothetical protein
LRFDCKSQSHSLPTIRSDPRLSVASPLLEGCLVVKKTNERKKKNSQRQLRTDFYCCENKLIIFLNDCDVAARPQITAH